MAELEATIAAFRDRHAAEAAVKKLAAAGFDITGLSLVATGRHTEEKVVGFYNTEDRVKHWARRGAIWGGLCGFGLGVGLLIGGVSLTDPAAGPLTTPADLAATIAITLVAGAILAGGLGAASAVVYGIGVLKDSLVRYEPSATAGGEFLVRLDSSLVGAHDATERMARAQAIVAGSIGPAAAAGATGTPALAGPSYRPAS